MSPVEAIELAERILALGETVGELIGRVITAVENQHPDAAAFSARMAALRNTAAGAAAYEESKHAGHPAKVTK